MTRVAFAVRLFALTGVLIFSASCSQNPQATGGKQETEPYSQLRARDLGALTTLERYYRRQPGSSNIKFDEKSGSVKQVFIGSFVQIPTSEGVHRASLEEVQAGEKAVFTALAQLKDLESLTVPYLPSGYQQQMNKLENLKELNISTEIDDSLAASLATHPRLESLGIHAPFLAPPHLEPLATLPRLKHVTLGDTKAKPDAGGNKLTEIDYLAKCKQLDSVTLSTRRLTPDDLKKLAQLKLRKLTLRSISMDATSPEDVRELLAEIPAITTLEELELEDVGRGQQQGSDKASLTGFDGLTQLKRLTVHNLALTPADLETIAKLTALEYLSIRAAYLPGQAFRALGTLQNLRELHYDVLLEPDALATFPPLPEVTSLSLRIGDRSAASFAPLKQWPQLRKVRFLERAPNYQGLDALAACEEILPDNSDVLRAASEGMLPKLQRLRVKMSPKTEEIKNLSSHPTLQGLSIVLGEVAGMYGEVKPKTIESLQSLVWLRELKLRSSKLGKQHLAALQQLPQLEYLDLSGNELTDDYVADLAALEQVKRLDLRQTRLTLAGLKELHELRPELIVLAP